MTKQEFIGLLKRNDACERAVEWCEAQETLEDIFKCDNGEWWSWLLARQPQFAEKCNLEKLSEFDWIVLLKYQPQFAEKCNIWNKFSGYNWIVLLKYQPQFAEKCNWEKLSEFDWRWLLIHQPHLEKYRGKKC